jgi:hypothetical protein
MRLVHILLGIVVLGISILGITSLIVLSSSEHEGFQSLSDFTSEEFQTELWASVKGPIKRLTSQLTDISMWKERLAMKDMTPVELARKYMLEPK